MQHPEASHRLLDGITDILIELLVAQYQAGADVLQVFESNAEVLPPARFRQFAFPYLQKLAREVKRRVPSIPSGGPGLIVFAKGGHYALEWLAAETEYDVLGVDWTVEPKEAVRIVNAAAARTGTPAKGLQGNLDPCELFGPLDEVRRSTSEMLAGFGDHPLIANLGHGMLPGHKPEALGAFLDTVHTATSPNAPA